MDPCQNHNSYIHIKSNGKALTMCKLDWNPVKNAINLRKHGIDFKFAERFNWDFAVIRTDNREDYGEHREQAFGFIGEVLHVLTFTERGDVTWVISLRKAEPRERKFYAEENRRQRHH